jgi:uncharacterized protein YfaS (alpha-2-macroglobulin family)
MAAAAITLSDQVCTIESDSTGAVITNGSTDGLISMTGCLRNHGPADVWLKISQVDTAAAAADVATTGAQAQLQIPLPAGSSLKIRRSYRSIAHKTAAGIATLSFVP